MKLLSAILATTLLSLDADSQWVSRLAFWSWGEQDKLEQRLQEVETQLRVLPELALINSSIRVGLKTGHTTEEDVRWIEVSLPEAHPVDTIVLVPPLAKAARAIVPGYGFPIRFKLEIFDEQDQLGVVLDHSEEPFPNPACFPVVARFQPQPVRRVRFTATEPWTEDGPEILALAELMILSGNRNLAPLGQVTSSSTRNAPRAWTRANLVDMITPLGLPVSNHPGGTLGYHSQISKISDAVKSVTLTLPKITDLDEVRLYPVRKQDVPLWFDYGFPALYKVEAATQADFSDAVLLQEVTETSQPLPGMNVVCISVPGLKARHIRLTANKLWYRRSDYVFALAELQVLKDGINHAPTGSFSASDILDGEEGAQWSLAALADGLTESGRILDLPDWIRGLEQRRDLEKEHHHLLSTRSALMERTENQIAYGAIGSGAGMTLLFSFLLWRQHRQRRLDAQRMHDKLARDLHDEIGSNLGSITLICSLATQESASRESIQNDMAEIGRVAEETANSMRDMVDLLQKPTSHGRNWLSVLDSLTERLLRGTRLDCALPALPLSREPDIETQREIYLFCKEVLHNISRHAAATHVRFHLIPTPVGLRIEIADNERGFDTSRPANGHGLGNLRERAASMKAMMHLFSKPSLGTLIHLNIPRTPLWQPAGQPTPI
jgi:signal transduction histidine kinase